MLKQISMTLMLVAAAATGQAAAQQSDAQRNDMVVFAERQAAPMGAGPSPALLTQLTAWLEANFQLAGGQGAPAGRAHQHSTHGGSALPWARLGSTNTSRG